MVSLKVIEKKKDEKVLPTSISVSILPTFSVLFINGRDLMAGQLKIRSVRGMLLGIWTSGKHLVAVLQPRFLHSSPCEDRSLEITKPFLDSQSGSPDQDARDHTHRTCATFLLGIRAWWLHLTFSKPLDFAMTHGAPHDQHVLFL